jgi:hypothetical protein
VQSTEIMTRASKVWLGDDGIVRKQFLANADETEADAKEAWEAIEKVSLGKKRPLLVDLTGLHSMDADARAYYASGQAATIVSAGAGLTRSAMGKVIGNFFLGFNRSRHPIRLFTSEDEALGWLKNYL